MFQHVLVAIGLTLFSTTSVAQPRTESLPAGIQEVARVEGITEYRLANGLQVLLAPDDSKPSTTVNVTYRVGSRNESYGETGMAHLLEHLLFKGTPTTTQPWAEFTKRGLRANGTTWYDRTNYFATFSASDDNLRWYLGWQADAMINSFIARADLDTEMTVVRNEMESGENNPNRVLLQQTLAAMYQWHNYGKSTIGARADVENVDIPRLQAFYRQYYQPDNATLIVSGRFDTARVLEIVARSFGPIPEADARDRQELHARPGAGRRARGDAAPGRRYAADLRRLPRAGRGRAPISPRSTLLAQVLGDTPGGRLYKQVVERQLAANTFGFALALADPEPDLHRCGAGADAGRREGARGDPRAPSTRSPASRSAREELERARTQWLNDWDKGFADPERIGVGSPRRSRRATGGCTSCPRPGAQGLARRRPARRRSPSGCAATTAPSASTCRRRSPNARRRRRGSTSRRWSRTTAAIAGAAQAESFDPTPAQPRCRAPSASSSTAASRSRCCPRARAARRCRRGCACASATSHR